MLLLILLLLRRCLNYLEDATVQKSLCAMSVVMVVLAFLKK
jgi:hypothetical protein